MGNRISNILDQELTQDYKLKLDNLIISDSSLSKLASFKQDAKNFGFKMMFKEREKHNILESGVATVYRTVVKRLIVNS